RERRGFLVVQQEPARAEVRHEPALAIERGKSPAATHFEGHHLHRERDVQRKHFLRGIYEHTAAGLFRVPDSESRECAFPEADDIRPCAKIGESSGPEY